MFLIHLVDPDGKPLTRLQDTDIPHNVISQIHDLRYGDVRMSLEDAVTFVRSKLVPAGYSPYPFRRDTPESLLDKFRSIVATFKFRATIDYWKERGVDFSTYLYIPEIDPVTGQGDMIVVTTTICFVAQQAVSDKAEILL